MSTPSRTVALCRRHHMPRLSVRVARSASHSLSRCRSVHCVKSSVMALIQNLLRNANFLVNVIVALQRFAVITFVLNAALVSTTRCCFQATFTALGRLRLHASVLHAAS